MEEIRLKEKNMLSDHIWGLWTEKSGPEPAPALLLGINRNVHVPVEMWCHYRKYSTLFRSVKGKYG